MKSLLFSHNHHLLSVKGCEAGLDVLAFEGDEALSQPFRYRIEFTSADHAISKEMMLMKAASLTLQAPVAQGFGINVQQPVRVIQGVVTGFERLSTSRDETHYALTLQPRLALLNRSHQNAIYQDQSVPQIVEKILRERHGLRGQDFLFSLTKTYPRREQVMQYGEDDLRFITRLLGEVGIWFRFTADTRLHIDVAEFCDSQQGYEKGLTLPSVPPSGQQSAGVDAVWEMACRHRVVEQQVSTRDYNYREATADMNAQVDVTRGETTTFGEAYHWGDNYLTAGNVHDRHPAPESGAFYARLRHERYLNGQTRMQATTSCPTLCPGQVLKVTGGEEVAGEFADGVLVTAMHSHARRDADFAVEFAGIPDSPDVGYRPEPGARPVMAGTLPARVTSTRENDTYGHIDKHGRYRVNMLFDRARWETGFESLWVRQSRPYAGDTYGLHLPLLAGTEVAIGFEDGNPDRPYIAGVLHDSARGEGFELRTDSWGAIRAQKGIFISADGQAQAQGQVLAMEPAVSLLKGAVNQVTEWGSITQTHHNVIPDTGPLSALTTGASDLKQPTLLMSAPQGIAAVTPETTLLHSGNGLYLQSLGEVNITTAQRCSLNASQAISLLAQQEGMRLVSAKGPLQVESHGDILSLTALKDITVQSTQGHLQLTAKNGITLGCGGAYIRLTPQGEVQIHGPGVISLKGQHDLQGPVSEEFPLPELPASVCKECLKKAQALAQGFVPREA
ncbi:type VI secretion system Vgr family protein [Klebsiella pneumoniae]|uniref:type VI secretion system Vgr family protein n=1 Tax=Klebsiella pneumoniae TaxID=573 RepID=UPI003EE41DC5